MRIPVRLAQHPIESTIATLLLLALLFGSVDSTPPRTGAVPSAPTHTAKM